MEINSDLLNRHSENEFGEKLRVVADAGAGVIHVRCAEVMRAVMAIRRSLLLEGNTYKEWNAVDGFRTFTTESMYSLNVGGDNMNNLMNAYQEPGKAIQSPQTTATDTGERRPLSFFTFVNPHFWVANNPIITHLTLHYASVLPSTDFRILLVTPDIELPDQLLSETVFTVRFDTPGLGELRESMDAILQGLEADSVEIELSEEDRERVCFVGAGMPKDQFDMSIAHSAVQTIEAGEAITGDSLAEGVSEGKTEQVKKIDLLELYHPEDMNNVGGMDRLKAWVEKRRACYSDEAREYGIEPPKGMVFVGPPGCLSGDTMIDYRRGRRNSGRPITLEELYKKFNGIPTSTRSWDTTMPTYIQSWMPDDTIAYNRVVSVIEAGEKPVWEIRTVDGDVLRLTENHPVAHVSGQFLSPAELTIGDKLLMRGSMLPVSHGGKRLEVRPPRRIVNLKYHPHGAYKEVDHYTYTRVAYARLVVEAHMNNVDVDEFIHALKRNASMSRTFNFLDPMYEVHHVDEDTTNDEIDNLMVYTKGEHARIHGANQNFNVDYLRKVTIESMARLPGNVMTYDIQMDFPANNFVANDFIVHNTGKSLAAKAVSKTLGVPLVRLDFGRVFNALVGESEARIRHALQMVESMSPCVLFCDEIDKGLGGIGGGGNDSGVSSRVLGTFLTWLNDNEHPVFTMVTANNITGLPPELMRRGRFDAIFAAGMPLEEERWEILNIHTRKRGYGDLKFKAAEKKTFLTASGGYVGAEIEAAVKDGLIEAYNAEEEFGMSHIVAALKDMVPLSEAFKEQIVEMTTWAQKHATAASSATVEARKRSTGTTEARRRSPRTRRTANKVH